MPHQSVWRSRHPGSLNSQRKPKTVLPDSCRNGSSRFGSFNRKLPPMKKLLLITTAAILVFAGSAQLHDPLPSPDLTKQWILWAWFYDPDGWAVYEDGLTLEQCNEDREHFHFRGEAMWRQAEDKDIEKHRFYCALSGKRHDAEPIGWMKTSDIGCSEIEGKTHCNALDHYTDVYLRGGSCATYGTPFYNRPNGKPIGLLWGKAQIVLGEKSKDGKWTRIWSKSGPTKKDDIEIMPYSLKSLRGCG